MSAKILALGPPAGELVSFIEKQRTLQAKHNFSFCICVGDFFGLAKEDGADAEEEEGEIVGKLLKGELNVPLTTYIMLGSHRLPRSVQARIDSTGGEVCTNVFLIAQGSVLVTSEGLKIGALGGDWDQAVWDAEGKPAAKEEDQEQTEPTQPSSKISLTPSSLQSILSSPHLFPSSSGPKPAQPSFSALTAPKPTGLDLLLLHTPPPSLNLLSPSAPSLPFALHSGADPLAEVMRRGRPRYVFWDGGEDGFWEREPFGWEGPGMTGRWTRGIKIGRFGGPAPKEGEKKARSFYAFSLAPLPTVAPFLPKPANATPNPFSTAFSSSSSNKRGAPLDSQGFIWGAQSGGGGKKQRTDGEKSDVPPPSYVCKKCNEPGHYIRMCPLNTNDGPPSGPPADYVCKICNEPGHFIRDCPQKGTAADSQPTGPPADYVCKICNEPGHFIRECPQKSNPALSGAAKQRELGPAECWFCLSNPKVTKHLIVSIGTETYLTLPKGQIPPTSSLSASKMVLNKKTGVPELPEGADKAKKASLVPGGGHVLIIPITHYPTLLSVPPLDAIDIISEIEQTKSALRDCYAQYGAVPVAFEVGRLSGKGGHAHIQIVPVPSSLTTDAIAAAFTTLGDSTGISFATGDAADAALNRARGSAEGNYFRVDLPNGGGKMVHLMERGGRFDLQFGRIALAKLLDIPERTRWQDCSQTDAEEKADAQAFKKAFARFAPA